MKKNIRLKLLISMKKILVGICGIGNGHINRQICVIEQLLKYDVMVVVATTEDKKKIINRKFSQIPVILVTIPWITCDDNGLDYKDCLIKYRNNNIDQYEKFFEFCLSIERIFKSKPDLIISDYEPNVAQYAYASMVPLLCMEQQSKFIYLDEINIKGASIKEEVYRLNYFFPKYDKRIISSFFPIFVNNEKVTIVSPIIPKINSNFKDSKKVVVYFSPYSDSEKYERILNVIKDIKNYTFNVYTINNYKKFEKYENINIHSFSDKFQDDLSSCSFLLSTGGHQLLSEALSLDIPIYVFPLETYEQKYNALMVEKYNLGFVAKDFSCDEINNFLSRYDEFHNNIICFKNKYYNQNWEDELKKLFD